MLTFIRLRCAALVLAGGLIPALAGCGSAPAASAGAADTALATAASEAALPSVTPERPRARVPAASRAVVRPAFGDRAISVAAKYVGTPYAWGGTTPRGFDCSGYTRYVYGKLGKKLPHSSAAQFRTVRKVGKKVQLGDLVFFHTGGGHVDHVGIYAGDGLMWHAPNARKPVRLDKISSQPKRWSAGRP